MSVLVPRVVYPFSRDVYANRPFVRVPIFVPISLSLSLILFFARSPGGMDDPLRTFVWRYSAFMSFFLCRTIWSIFSIQWFLLSAASTVCTACRPLPPCACLARFLFPTRCARPPLASLNFIHHLRPTKNAERNGRTGGRTQTRTDGRRETLQPPSKVARVRYRFSTLSEIRRANRTLFEHNTKIPIPFPPLLFRRP